MRTRSTQVRLTILVATLLAVMAVVSCRMEPEKIRKQMDEYLFQARVAWKFNGAALVAYDGNVILSKGYGMADREMGIPNSSNTKFFVGSITKQFTAAAVLQLMEQGKLNLDDSISAYLTDFPPSIGDIITIRHLLTHTSGLPNHTDIPEIYISREEPVTETELYAMIKSLELEFEPGEEFMYSNSGYIILGEIIERVSGMSYEAYLHRHILDPAGMHSTGYARREAAVPDRATGYTVTKDFDLILAPYVDLTLLHSAGALYSTVEDMLRWDQALCGDSILSRESREMMFTPHSGNYGFGWFIKRDFGRKHVFHCGFLDGFNCTISCWPEDHLVIVVFSNEDEAPVHKIALSLAAMAFGKPYDFPETKQPGEVDTALLAEYVGMYRVNDELYRVVIEEDGKLYDRIRGHNPIQLIPESRDTFFMASDHSVRVVFSRNKEGAVDSQYVYDRTTFVPAGRLSREEVTDLWVFRTPVEVDSTTMAKYEGLYRIVPEYRNQNIDIRLRVESGLDHLSAEVERHGNVQVVPSSNNSFFHRQSNFSLHFVENGDEAVIGCVISFGPAGVYAEKIE